MKALARCLHDACTAATVERSPRIIRRQLETLLGEPLRVTKISNRGYGTPTFLMRGNDGRGWVVKVASRWREHFYRRMLTSRQWRGTFVYLRPEERFAREHRILSELWPSGIVPRPLVVTDRYAVREYVVGEALLEKCRHNDARAGDYYSQGLALINRLHEHGWYHNDAGPHNVIIEEKSRTGRLVDFEYQLNAAVCGAAANAARDYARFIQRCAPEFAAWGRADEWRERTHVFLREAVSEETSRLVLEQLASSVTAGGTAFQTMASGHV